MSSYNINDVDLEAQNRYREKLRVIEMDSCPYQLPADEWIDCPTNWPELEWPEVLEYLVNSPGIFTREAMKNRKSLEAYNQFVSGWVKTVYYYQKKKDSSFMIFKADVIPSQRLNEAAHTPWVALNIVVATVVCAHCSCMAGLGESCSHVAALLFKIEAAVRAGYTKTLCTEVACQWNNDFVKKIQPLPICKVQFYGKETLSKFKASKEKLESFSKSKVKPTEQQQVAFMQKLKTCSSKPIVLHTFSATCDEFKPKYHPAERAKLPATLRSHYSSTNANQDYQKLCDEFLKKLTVSEAVIDYIEQLTIKQHQSNIWHEMRSGRITASVAHDVLRTNIETPASSLILKICQQSRVYKTTVPALRWGIDHEKCAMDEYKLLKSADHENFTIKSHGLKLHSFSYLGATPDGSFTCTCHNSSLLIEIKCPYSKKDTENFEDALLDRSFCLDNNKNLKITHKYYTQVQLQMFVCKFRKTEFVVWTPNWMVCTTVERNDEYLSGILPKLEHFYKRNIVPEILLRKLENGGNKITRPDSKLKKYCVCQTEYNEEDNEVMIGCDSSSCKYEWFHLNCIGLKRVPKQNWYCKFCKATAKNGKENRRPTKQIKRGLDAI